MNTLLADITHKQAVDEWRRQYRATERKSQRRVAILRIINRLLERIGL